MLSTITKPNVIRGYVAVTIMARDEGFLEIYEYEDSGRIITRAKVDTITGVLHPGIIIGVDRYGRIWVAHNHYLNKRPTIDRYEKYMDEADKMFFDPRPVKYNRQEIVRRAIAEVKKAKTYTWVTYNCQIFVNLIVRDEHRSESVDKISNGTMVVGAIVTVLGLLSGNKGLTIAGGSILGVGAGVKGISRMDL